MTSRFELRLPDLGEGITEGIVGQWLAEPGSSVEEDQPLVEVETDKAVVEIPSPVAGRLAGVLAAPGAVVPVGSVLAVIEMAAATVGANGGSSGDLLVAGGREDGPELSDRGNEGAATAQPPGETSGIAATPGARRRARELGVDLARVAMGNAVVREEQVVAYAQANPPAPATEDQRLEAARGSSSVEEASAIPAGRRVIASRLTKAAAIPTVTNVDQVDFEAVLQAGVSPLAAVSFVVARALHEHPRLNLATAGEGSSQQPVHLGIATQGPAGLVVPVVRHADRASLAELGAAITDVTSRARDGAIRPEELSGSTFTITSAGRLSGLWSTPLLNLPELAILGLYRIEQRAVVLEGMIVARRVANLSITFDHRALDGLDAARFLATVKEQLEGWAAPERSEPALGEPGGWAAPERSERALGEPGDDG